MTLIYSVAVAAAFTWTGFVGAISFMEAWLKFRAPGITIPLGLSIGKLVFKALNRVEWVFAIIIGSCLIIEKEKLLSAQYLFYLSPLILLIAQTIWLLPALDARAQLRIQGKTPPSSKLHIYYIMVETIKVLSLCVFGIDLLIN